MKSYEVERPLIRDGSHENLYKNFLEEKRMPSESRDTEGEGSYVTRRKTLEWPIYKPGAGRSWKRQGGYTSSFIGSMDLPIPGFRLFRFQMYEKISVCCFKPPSLWHFARAALVKYCSDIKKKKSTNYFVCLSWSSLET